MIIVFIILTIVFIGTILIFQKKDIDSCDSSSECMDGKMCMSGRCQFCRNNLDCPKGLLCTEEKGCVSKII